MAVVDYRPLTAQDQTIIDYYDGVVVEQLASARTNVWVEVRIDKATRARVVAVLKNRLESRGRQVGVFEEESHWRLTLPPPVAALPAVKALNNVAIPLPAIQSDNDLPLYSIRQPRVLVRMPTRNRPAQALNALAAYRMLAGYPIEIEVVVDRDDEKMASSEVLQRLCALGASVSVGDHNSKIEAVNGGRISDWDILVLASDDMIPVTDGYARIIVEEMNRHFPYFDGLIYFDDGYAGERCCTLPIFGKRLYDQFGYVYEPSYKSLCCDVEQTEVLRAMRRAVYVNKMIIEHMHPAAGKASFDPLYTRNESLFSEDKPIFERRKNTLRPHAQFGFDSPPLALSICIATLRERRNQLNRLLACIYDQIIRDAPRQVEVLVDSETGEIGAKRQRLIEKTNGHYVAHVDDDDWISFDYIKRVVNAIVENDYESDCVELTGAVTTNGGSAGSFHHSIKYREWYTNDEGVHCRSPNHLNPVRRELALKAGFPAGVSHGEDHEFSKRLLPLLSREAPVNGGPLYHYWFCKPEK